ncbi:hypothetical protein BC827DRAFT_649917 [Russula dissimulans]|nr:hypothetical protein BC827DRAFT_649917 [Russula dissimulans]
MMRLIFVLPLFADIDSDLEETTASPSQPRPYRSHCLLILPITCRPPVLDFLPDVSHSSHFRSSPFDLAVSLASMSPVLPLRASTPSGPRYLTSVASLVLRLLPLIHVSSRPVVPSVSVRGPLLICFPAT